MVINEWLKQMLSNSEAIVEIELIITSLFQRCKSTLARQLVQQPIYAEVSQ